MNWRKSWKLVAHHYRSLLKLDLNVREERYRVLAQASPRRETLLELAKQEHESEMLRLQLRGIRTDLGYLLDEMEHPAWARKQIAHMIDRIREI